MIWASILGHIQDDLDKFCPIRRFHIKNYKPDWVNDELLQQIRDWDYYYKKAKRTRDEDDWNIARHLRNITNINIMQAKADFVMDKLQQFSGDSSKFWKELKKVFPTSKGKSRAKIVLKDGDKKVDEKSTADFINAFFVNVGNVAVAGGGVGGREKRARAGKENRPKDKERGCDKSVVGDSLGPVLEREVYELVKTIKSSKSTGLENINGLVIKEAFKTLLTPLTYLYNVSLKEGIFPNSWKVATVVPIPKGGDRQQVGNLRPISLLPQPGKVLEKLVHGQIISFLEEKNLLSSYQHGFRKERSTSGAVYQLLERINLNMDRRIPTLVTYIDFKKAFDCVQFDILLRKIDKLGLNSHIPKWLKSYLANRQQRVMANGVTSNILDIRQGVPQGSILGPLLYLIYADDLKEVIKKCGFAFYADDTVLYLVHANFVRAKSNMKRNLCAINRWCRKNGIYMNTNKTKFMIFGSKHTLAKVKDFKLVIEGQEIERVLSYTYLGITLDPSLTFDKHVSKLVIRVTNRVRQLKSMHTFLTSRAALLVYKNMILPIVEYGDFFLSATTKCNRDKLQVLQNKALRVIHKVDRCYSSDTVHLDSRLLKLKYRREIHLVNFMFGIREDLKAREPERRYGIRTRSSNKLNFALRRPNTEKYKNCASYQGIKSWNRLPTAIQQEQNKLIFKNKVLNHITSKIKDQNPKTVATAWNGSGEEEWVNVG